MNHINIFLIPILLSGWNICCFLYGMVRFKSRNGYLKSIML